MHVKLSVTVREETSNDGYIYIYIYICVLVFRTLFTNCNGLLLLREECDGAWREYCFSKVKDLYPICGF